MFFVDNLINDIFGGNCKCIPRSSVGNWEAQKYCNSKEDNHRIFPEVNFEQIRIMKDYLNYPIEGWAEVALK